MKKTALIIFLLTLHFCGYCQYERIFFYVVAHPDQWQLFMGDNAFNDIASLDLGQSKVVFIYTTAGDESCSGAHLDPSKYIARQEGAHNSIEFCSDDSYPHSQWSLNHDPVNGHPILKYTYNNVVSYCLRLPDGCSGHSIFGQSMQSCHDGANSSMSAVDSSTTYSGWNDLVATVSQIMLNEEGNINDIYINTADTDVVLNKGDDPDRIYSGLLAINSVSRIPHLTMNLFQEVVTATLPSNLDNIGIATKAALLSQFDYVRTENGLPSAWTPVNINYVSRSYYRTITR